MALHTPEQTTYLEDYFPEEVLASSVHADEQEELTAHDAELLEIARAQHTGDSDEDQRIRQQGFAELYARHYAEVHSYAKQLTRNSEDGEDLTQITFELMMLGIQQFKDDGRGLAPWLRRVEKNKFINAYRRRKYVTLPADEASMAFLGGHGEWSTIPTEQSVETTAVNAADNQAVIRKLIDKMSETHDRTVVTERVIEMYLWVIGYTKREIAEQQGKPYGTVMSGMARFMSQAAELGELEVS